MKKIIILIISCLILSGCSYSDLNSSSIVSTMAISKDDLNYKISILTIIPNEEDPYLELTEATGVDPLKVTEELRKLSTKELYFDHMSALIINEEVLKDYKTLEKIITKNNIKKDVHLFLVNDNIDEIINFYKEQSPVHTISSTIQSTNEKNVSFKDLEKNESIKVPTFSYKSKPYFLGYTKIKK